MIFIFDKTAHSDYIAHRKSTGNGLDNGTGNILKAKREELGLDIKDISAKIKIRENFLVAIENGDKSEVPDSYYDLFVKKYSEYLKVELPEYVEKKKESDTILEMLTEKNGNGKKKSNLLTGFKRTLLFAYIHRKFFIGAFAVFLFALFVRHTYNILNTGEKTEKSESMVKIITIEGDPDDRISIDIRDAIMIDDDKNEVFHIRITASDSCYLCYYSDTLSVKETIIPPGRYIEARPEKIFEAKIGKSGAIDIELNGQKVLTELKELKNASSFISAGHRGAVKVKRSEKIGEYLYNMYGLE
jgi:transcriptional regulator with XRE-family HTH domain